MRIIQGKKALITGAASGIGRAIALALAAEQADVYLLDINEAGANDVATEARRFGVEAIAARCDVTDRAQISASIQQLLGRWGALDILVNNAGVAFYGPTENMTAEQWDWLLSINLRAGLQFTRELMPTLLAQGEGHVLNVCSIAGLVAGGRAVAYQVSKFGLVGFTEGMRSEYVRRGVGLTAVCPGPVLTKLYDSAISGRANKKVPTPPAWACATPEQVARKAIRGIKKNKPLVLVTPMAHALWYLKRLSPGLIDRINCLGRRKKRPSLAEGTQPVAAPVMVSWQDTAADRAAAAQGRPATGKLEFERHYFQSHGTRCESWLLRPAGSEPSPLVLMAHGFAAEKSFRLPAYAERFMRQGMAVLLFDHRHFGGSGGMPRHLISHRRQRQDWQAALDFGGNLPGIDASRIALWGTSLSGGHALVCAADNPSVAAVVAQTPLLEPLRMPGGFPPRFVRRALGHALVDLGRTAVGQAPHYAPVVGEGPAFAAMSKPNCEAGYRQMLPDGASWNNQYTARSLLTLATHRPLAHLARVQCPVLLVAAEHDQLIAPRSIQKAAQRLRDCQVVTAPIDHFSIYVGEGFEFAVQAESEFLQHCLGKAYTLPFSIRAESGQKAQRDRRFSERRAA